jgi:hypothetical protein
MFWGLCKNKLHTTFMNNTLFVASVFVTGLIFAVKARSRPLGYSTRVGTSLAHQYYTRVEVGSSDKFNRLPTFLSLNYVRKKLG